MRFPPAGSLRSVLKLCPLMRVVDFYLFVGLAAPVLFVHKGQICLNVGADERDSLCLQTVALALLQMGLRNHDGNTG